MSTLVKLAAGGFMDIVDGDATWIHKRLIDKGLAGYEPHTQAAILALGERSGSDLVFYDVGCHFGLYAALVCMSFPESTCVAFEPTPTTIAMAKRTFAANGLQVELVEKAVSDREGPVELFLSPKAETSNSLDAAFRPGGTPIPVEAVSIDSMVLAETLRAPTLMKIDVESAEASVLAGAMETIRRFRPWIVCEILGSGKAGDMTPVLQRLENLGYCFYHVNNDTVWPRCDADTVLMRATWQEFADWVFSPSRLNRNFFESVAEWRDAVAACTADQTKIIEGLRLRP